MVEWVDTSTREQYCEWLWLATVKASLVLLKGRHVMAGGNIDSSGSDTDPGNVDD